MWLRESIEKSISKSFEEWLTCLLLLTRKKEKHFWGSVFQDVDWHLPLHGYAENNLLATQIYNIIW